MRRMVCGLTGLIVFLVALDLPADLETARNREAGASHFSTHWTAPSCRYLVSDWRRG